MTTPIDWPVTVEDLVRLRGLVQELRFRAEGASQVKMRAGLAAIDEFIDSRLGPVASRGGETGEEFSEGQAKAGGLAVERGEGPPLCWAQGDACAFRASAVIRRRTYSQDLVVGRITAVLHERHRVIVDDGLGRSYLVHVRDLDLVPLAKEVGT